jgi:glycosyltransferase involved in cell wall biosynthesis
VLLEAMSCARPVIAIKYGGPAEIVDDSVGHAIEPLGSDHAMSELSRCLHDVFTHPEVWKQRGMNGRKCAEGKFGWDRKITSILDIYANAIHESAREKHLASVAPTFSYDWPKAAVHSTESEKREES